MDRAKKQNQIEQEPPQDSDLWLQWRIKEMLCAAKPWAVADDDRVAEWLSDAARRLMQVVQYLDARHKAPAVIAMLTDEDDGAEERLHDLPTEEDTDD